jgi:hypothetical protein
MGQTTHEEGASGGLAGGGKVVTCHAMVDVVEHTRTPSCDRDGSLCWPAAIAQAAAGTSTAGIIAVPDQRRA